jgi:hypothetical protein
VLAEEARIHYAPAAGKTGHEKPLMHDKLDGILVRRTGAVESGVKTAFPERASISAQSGLVKLVNVLCEV